MKTRMNQTEINNNEILNNKLQELELIESMNTYCLLSKFFKGKL